MTGTDDYTPVVRDNPVDAYLDAILHGTGLYKHPATPPTPEPATDPYEMEAE